MKRYILDTKKISHLEKERLTKRIDELIGDSWGHFPYDFLTKHIADSKFIALIEEGVQMIGVAIISEKQVASKLVIYLEFVVLKKEYQGQQIGTDLTYFVVKKILTRHPLRLLFGIDIMFLTSNIRALVAAAKFAKKIYPDPLSDPLPLADEETWGMAKALLQNSWNPDRRLDREGLVLHGSYSQTPWLVYNASTAPYHTNQKINAFAERYLQYSKNEDREFIVSMKIDYYSILKYTFKNIL